MEGCRKTFLFLLGVAAFLAFITFLAQSGILGIIDNPGGSVPDVIPVPGR